MKKKIKLKYIYLEPKTEEEKKEQQKRIDDVFDMLFKEMFKDK